MRRILVFCLAVGLVLAGLSVASAEGMYVSGKLGLFDPNSKDDGLDGFDAGFSGELAFGMRLHRNFAAELGVGYQMPGDLEEDDVTVEVSVLPVTLTAKGILPVMADKLDLFLGAGVGYYFANVEASGEGDSLDESGNGFGFHVVAGADYKLTNNFSLGIEAKWNTADVDFGGDIDEKVDVGGMTYHVVGSYLF